jgi:hypothetical protein
MGIARWRAYLRTRDAAQLTRRRRAICSTGGEARRLVRAFRCGASAADVGAGGSTPRSGVEESKHRKSINGVKMKSVFEAKKILYHQPSKMVK